MKHGTELKLKFRLLKQLLALPLWQVKGLLQSLWDFTGENAVTGDIGRFSNEEIACGIEYSGDAEAIIEMLVDTRWIDRHAKHRLVIHGWKEHCENIYQKRVQRMAAKGGQSWAEDDVGVICPTTADNGGQRRTTADNGGQRQPAYSYSSSYSTATSTEERRVFDAPVALVYEYGMKCLKDADHKTPDTPTQEDAAKNVIRLMLADEDKPLPDELIRGWEFVSHNTGGSGDWPGWRSVIRSFRGFRKHWSTIKAQMVIPRGTQVPVLAKPQTCYRCKAPFEGNGYTMSGVWFCGQCDPKEETKL